MINILITAIIIIVCIFGGLIIFGAVNDPEFQRRHPNLTSSRMLVVIVLAVIGLILLSMMITIVPAGHVGVKDTFGNVEPTVFQPGIHLKSPVMSVIAMSVKTQEKTEIYPTLTNEGLDVTIDLTVLYSLKPSEAPTIYKTVGTDYSSIIITPTVRSVVRNVIAEFDAKSLYDDDRTVIATKISENLIPSLEKRGILVESVLIRGVDLPQRIKDAIAAKKEAEQLITKKEYEVQEAEMEARRKVAEAQGIADSQAIIDNSLTPSYLQWYWIDAMKNNPNAIYVPIGSDGMPMFKSIA